MWKWIGIAAGVLCLMAQGAAAVEQAEFYRVEKSGGAWWFVRPSGERFLSLGVNCVLPGSDRDKYDPEKPAYAAFRHYDSTNAWADDTLERLKSWNFNTIGGWSHLAVQRGEMPYINVLHLGSYLGVPWIDLFADNFAQQMDQMADRMVAPQRDDTQLLGWCSDNELGWYPDTLFRFHLGQPAQSNTRQRLLELLNEHYDGDFAALTRDFSSPEANSFEQLATGGTLQPMAGGAARQVVLEFTRRLAERYYRVVHRAIRRADPNHLILGDRYISFCPEVVAQAAAPYVDVITTNYDWPASTDGYLPPEYLRRLHELSGRPVLVTEHYVAATENRSGNPNSGNIFTTVSAQPERAAAVDNRLQQLAQQPYVVGAHWFCFADEPPGGRPRDGEDYNFGLVDIVNRPYEELVAVMTESNLRIPDIHAKSGAITAAPQRAVRSTLIPRAPSLPLDGIAMWDKRGNVLPQTPVRCATDLLASWDADHVYVAVMGLRFVDRQFYPNGELTPSELLKLRLTAAAAVPVCVRFGVGDQVAVDDPAVECRAWQVGVRYTAIAALPAAMFGKPQLEPGDEVELNAAILDLRDNAATRWKTKLKLD